MPSYTHLRRAMPGLVAHFSSRTSRRCAATTSDWGGRRRAVLNASRSGASPAPITPSYERLASVSRFLSRRAARIDASSDRDFAAAFLFACRRHGPFEPACLRPDHLRDEETRLLSALPMHQHEPQHMMPQKKNPDPLELIVADRPPDWSPQRLDVTMRGCRAGYNKIFRKTRRQCSTWKTTPRAPLSTLSASSTDCRFFRLRLRGGFRTVAGDRCR